MADTRITDAPTITEAADGDFFPIVDVSDTTDNAAGSLKKITKANITPTVPVKATGAEVTNGTDDDKFATPKAIADAGITITPVKATGAEINTGIDDAKFATAKAIADSDVAFLSDIPTLPVKASGSEINTGTDDAKFATAKAIADSNVAFIADIPVKAIGSEVDTGTDDAKFVTAKSIADSHNVPSVAPGTSGNVLTSDGTDWTSAAASGGGGVSVAPTDGMVNGKISVSVASNDLTISLLTLAGETPSEEDPVYATIDGITHTITYEVTLTKNEGTNYGSAGDMGDRNWYVYLGYDTGTSAVIITASQIPYANYAGTFSTTATSYKTTLNTNLDGVEAVVNVGCFRAILSASAAYQWSIGGTGLSYVRQGQFMSSDYPMYFKTSGATGFAASIPVIAIRYWIVGKMIVYNIDQDDFSGGTSNATGFTIPLPMNVWGYSTAQWYGQDNGTYVFDVTATVSGATLTLLKNGSATGWTNSGTKAAWGQICCLLAA